MSNKKKLTRITLISAGLILAGAGLGTGLFARYVSNNREKAEMTSSQFHFTSDYLEEESGKDIKTYDITDWGEGFDILLYNYEKENLAQISADPIEYQIKLTGSDWVCDTDNSDDTLTEVAGQTNTWTATLGTGNGTDSSAGSENQSDGKISRKIRLKPVSDAEESSKVTVTVTSQKPYKKTIQAEFRVTSKTYPDFILQDKRKEDGSCVLLIQSNDYDGDVRICWDTAAYEPDRTNSLMRDWTENEASTQAQTISVSPHTTYSLIFLYQGSGSPEIQGVSGNTTNGTTITLQ